MNCNTPGFPVLCYLLKFAQTHVRWLGDSIQPSYPLSPSSFAFDLSQHQDTLQSVGSSILWWPKYWSFSISPSNEYSGLRSFTIDWFDLHAVWGILKIESSPAPQVESISSSVLSLLYGPTLTSIHGYWKNYSFDWASLMAQWQRTRLPVQETQVRSLGQWVPLEKEIATHSSILPREIP